MKHWKYQNGKHNKCKFFKYPQVPYNRGGGTGIVGGVGNFSIY